MVVCLGIYIPASAAKLETMNNKNNNKRLRASSGFTAASCPKYTLDMEYSYSNPISSPNATLYGALPQTQIQQNNSFAPMMRREGSSQSNISLASTGSTMNSSTFDYDRFGSPLSPSSSTGMMNSPQVSSYGTGMARTISGSSFASPTQTFNDLPWGSSQSTNASQYGFGMQRQDSGQGSQQMLSPVNYYNDFPTDCSFPTSTGYYTSPNDGLVDIDSLSGNPSTNWWSYYDFHVAKEGGIHTLKEGFLVTTNWPKTRESPKMYDPSKSNKGKQVFKCYYEGCPSNPFSRPFDLERHFKSTHAGKPTVCDYPKCMHRTQGKSFTRPDHEREHYREYHSEDLIKKGEKQIKAWLMSSGRQTNSSWWRCGKCLKRNKTSGWKCENCGVSCESERVEVRNKNALKEESRQSSTDSTSTIVNTRMNELTFRTKPTLKREDATLKSSSKTGRSSKTVNSSSRRPKKESEASGTRVKEEQADLGTACDCYGGYIYDSNGLKFECMYCNNAISMAVPTDNLKRKNDDETDYGRWDMDNNTDMFSNYRY